MILSPVHPPATPERLPVVVVHAAVAVRMNRNWIVRVRPARIERWPDPRLAGGD